MYCISDPNMDKGGPKSCEDVIDGSSVMGATAAVEIGYLSALSPSFFLCAKFKLGCLDKAQEGDGK